MGRKIYCKKCGSELDANKKCTGCGKQYFKLNVRLLLLILFVLLLISIISCETYYIYSHKQDVTELENNYAIQKESLEKEKNELLEKLKKYIQYTYNEDEELVFFRNHAVIVSNNGTKKYHNYGCEDLMLNSYWIYNTEAAEGQGYTMCKKCYEKEIDTSDDVLTRVDILIDKIKYLNQSEKSDNSSSTLKVNPKFLESSGDNSKSSLNWDLITHTKEDYVEKVENGTNTKADDRRAELNGWVD